MLKAVKLDVEGNAQALVYADGVIDLDGSMENAAPLGLVYHLPTPILENETPHMERVYAPLMMINGVAGVQFVNAYTVVVQRALAVAWDVIKPHTDKIFSAFVVDEKKGAAKLYGGKARGILTEEILRKMKDAQRNQSAGIQMPPRGIVQ